MAAICFEYDGRGWNRDLWLYLVTAFGPEAYERGRPDDMEKYNNFGITAIESIKDLPKDRPIVVMQPEAGALFNGEQPLITYKHPENAIYVFGSDSQNIGPEDFEGLEYDLVYIPQVDKAQNNELWSHQAGAILLYDLLAKGVT